MPRAQIVNHNRKSQMIVYASRFLTRAEVWYDDEPADTRSVDWVVYQQRSQPVPGTKWRYFHNYFIDLTQSAGQLLKQLNEDTAYKIRRARDRDHIVCESCDLREPGALDCFEKEYNQFAAAKGLSRLNRAQTESMAAAGVLDLSVARDAQGNGLVYHANYRGRQRATQLHSPSLYWKFSGSASRNMIGRANRYLIWSDLMRYQEQGLKCFDFGGWYPGTTDPVLLGINEFKKGFGGRVVREYVCEQILSRKGWFVLTAARLLKQAKLFPVRATAPIPSSQRGATPQPSSLMLKNNVAK